MGSEMSNEFGKVQIAQEVIATIAGAAAVECYGLVGMASRSITDGVAELLGKEAYGKGVEITFSDGRVIIDLYIIVNYGNKISEVARNVMERVKYAIESVTGLDVEQVNVYVQGVRVSSTN